VFLEPDNAKDLIASSGLVVDCLDNIPSRFALETAAKYAGMPMVSAAIAGLSGHLTTIFPNDKGLVNIYGPEDQVTATGGVELELGCLAPGVNLVASLACTETVKVLLKRNHILSGRLLVVDLSDYTFETLKLG
jgi:molybdopterin-synthase adenylyltransferase